MSLVSLFLHSSDSHILSSPPVFLLLTCCVTYVTLQWKNRWTARGFELHALLRPTDAEALSSDCLRYERCFYRMERERDGERERDRWLGGGWRVRGWVTAAGWLTMTHILVVTSPGDSPSHHSDFALFWGRIAPVLHQMQLSIHATRGSSRPPWTGQCSSLGWPLKPVSGKNTP